MSVGTFGVANYVSTSLSAVDRVTAFVNPGISGVDTTAAVFTPVSLFSAPYPRASGFTPLLNQPFYVRQTFNAPVTNAAAAGDPIGLWLPSQSPADVTNLLVNTDALVSGTQWSATATIASRTADVANTPEGVPTADFFFEATTASGERILWQDFTLPVAQVTYHFVVSIKAAGRGFAQIRLGGANGTFGALIYTINLSNGATVNSSAVGGASGLVTAITTEADSYYRVLVGGLLSSDCTIGRVEVYLHNGSGTTYAGVVNNGIYVCKAQAARGTTALAYQPNAGSLGGSNRRTGGSNMLLWSDSLDGSPWVSFQTTISLAGDTGPTGIANAVRIIAGNNGSATYTRTQTLTLPDSTACSFGCALKAGTITGGLTLQFRDKAGGVSFSKTLDLSNGTLSSTESGGTTSVAVDSNGYYLLKFENVASATGGTTPEVRIVFTGTGNGSNYFIAWGARFNLGATLATYSRNIDQLGGLLLSAPLFQSTSANRGTLARRPASGIRNRSQNNTNAGAAAGSSGSLPTTWAQFTTLTGLTRTIALPGNDANGKPIISIRYQGTPSAAGPLFIQFDTSTSPTAKASNGQQWTTSAYYRLAAGTVTGATFENWVSQRDSGGNDLGGNSTTFVPTSTIARVSTTFTNNNASVVSELQFLRINLSGAAVDFTIEISGTQPEVAGSASAVQLVNYSATGPIDITESGQPDVWHTYWDGTSDFGTFGVQSFGSASLFADAGQAWTVWGVFRTLGSGGVCVAKASATVANRTFETRNNNGTFRVTLRGNTTDALVNTANNGAFHAWCLRWDGSAATLRVDSEASTSCSVGAVAQESEDIIVGSRTSSSPANFFPGHNDVAMIDRALTDGEIATLMSNLNTVYRSGL